MTSLRRMAALSLLSIPLTAEMVFGEVLFAAHIVFLVSNLGFVWGLVVFAAAWVALGLAILIAADYLWPRVGHSLKALARRLGDGATELLRRAVKRELAAILAGVGLLMAVAAAVVFRESGVVAWTVDHRGDVAMFLLTAAVVSAILIVLARLGRGLVGWARGMAETAGPAGRGLAVLVAMAFLGPALGWPILRLLQYSRPTVYALTFLGGPIFGAVWVPLYGLGVWGLVQGLL